jgi:WD40 repeat protein
LIEEISMDTPVRTFTSGTFVKSAAVSNNNTAVVGSELNDANEGVHVFNLDTGQLLQTLRGPVSSGVLSVAISPDGTLAVASTQGIKAVLWNANTGSLLSSAQAGIVADNNSRIAFSPDGQVILSSFFGDLTIFDATLAEKSKFRVHIDGGSVFAMAPSPEGRFLAAGYVRFDGGDDLVVFDLLSGQANLKFVANRGSGVTCVAWTGNNILTGSGDGTIKLWNAQSGAAVSRPFPTHSKPVNALAVSSDGRLALSGSNDLTMKVMEVSTGKELHSFNHTDGQVTAVAFASNAKFAVSSSGKSMKLWDLTGL